LGLVVKGKLGIFLERVLMLLFRGRGYLNFKTSRRCRIICLFDMIIFLINKYLTWY